MPRGIIPADLVVVLMSVSRLGLVVVLAMLAVSGRAHAQGSNPLTYWTPGWPVGFSGDAGAGTYGNFPSFDTRDSRGFGATRTNFGNGFFVGSSRTELLGTGGIAANSAFGNFGSVYGEGSQFGYSFKGASGMPVSLYAGFETLKYNNGFGSGSPFAAFELAVRQFAGLQGAGRHRIQADREHQPVVRHGLSREFRCRRQRERVAARRQSVHPGRAALIFPDHTYDRPYLGRRRRSRPRRTFL